VTPAIGQERGTIGFFLGCVMSLVFSDASRATIQLLTALGYRVITPRHQVCCGAPNMLGGDLAGLQEAARTNVEVFAGYEVDFIVTDCGGAGGAEEVCSAWRRGGSGRIQCQGAGYFRDSRPACPELALLLQPLALKVTYHDPCHIAIVRGSARSRASCSSWCRS